MLELGNKKQYNVNIHPKIINRIRKLSAEYSVPQYAIAEHLLEIGCFYTYKILESLKKREILREHIIDRHMLDSGYDDAEDLMRLGEGRYASELFSMAKVVVRDFGVLNRLCQKPGENKILMVLKNPETSYLILSSFLPIG